MVNGIGNYIEINVHKLLLLQEGLLWVQTYIFSDKKNLPIPQENNKEKQAISHDGQIYVEKTGCAYSFEPEKAAGMKVMCQNLGESHEIGARRKVFSFGGRS